MKKQFLLSLLAVSTSVAAQQSTSQKSDDIEHVEVKKHYQPYRGNVPLIDTPQAIDRISAETLNNEGITRFLDALDFSPTIVRQNASGGLFDSFA